MDPDAAQECARCGIGHGLVEVEGVLLCELHRKTVEDAVADLLARVGFGKEEGE